MKTTRRSEREEPASWRPLSDFVRTLRPILARSLEVKGGDRAAVLSALPSGVLHFAQLALAFGPQLLVHEVRPEAAVAVDATDLHAVPREPPRLLRRAFLLEAGRPERGERLFGDTCCLGGYELEGATFLVGLDYPDGSYVAVGRPRWEGGDEEAAEGVGDEALAAWTWVQSKTTASSEAWATQAARFALMLGLLLDAEGTPLRLLDEGRRPPGQAPKGRAPRPGRGWTVRHVSLADPAGPARPEAGEVAPGGDEPGAPEGRAAATVGVRGHLRRQRFGEGRSQMKWIYVAGYASRRWLAPGPRKVVVLP